MTEKLGSTPFLPHLTQSPRPAVAEALVERMEARVAERAGDDLQRQQLAAISVLAELVGVLLDRVELLERRMAEMRRETPR